MIKSYNIEGSLFEFKLTIITITWNLILLLIFFSFPQIEKAIQFLALHIKDLCGVKPFFHKVSFFFK